MKLAIDIGNTTITVGLIQNEEIIKRTNFFPINDLLQFLNKNFICKIEKIIISSVVPKLTTKYIEILNNKYDCKICIIDYKMSMLSLKVPNPETIGTDRLCNIFATIKLYQIPAIIVDFGTATTYDVIDTKGVFIGGIIAPGIETSAQHLIDKASLLQETELKFPKNVIGIDTKENIQSGVMYGAIDQVSGMIKRICNETKTPYSIILTGGFSKLLSCNLSLDYIQDQDLTLKGMYYISELHK